MNKLNKEKIFLLFIALNPILDIVYSITEYYMKISLPINQGIRVGFIIYSLYVFNMKKYYKYIFALSGILLINEITYIVRGLSLNLLSNLGYDAKLIAFIVFVFVTYELLKNKRVESKDIIKAICISVFIITLGIIVPTILGFGMDTYTGSTRFGFKGLFNAQNAITATLLIQLPIVLITSVVFKEKKYLLLFLIAFFVLNLVGTKVGSIGSIFVVIVSIIFMIINKFRKKIKFDFFMKVFYWLSGGITFIILIAYNKIIILLNNLPYNKNEFPTFFSYLVSNRDAQIRILNQFMIHDPRKIWSLFFGLGFTQGNDVLKSTGIGFHLIEMDFNGIYYYSGILMFLIFTIFFIYITYISMKTIFINRDINDALIGISFFVGTIHSLLGGHVLYEAITNFYLAIIIGLIIYRYTQICSREYHTGNRKKRVLFISWTLSAGGGVESILSKLVSYFNFESYDIHMFEYINFGINEKDYPKSIKRLKSILSYPKNKNTYKIKMFSIKEKILDNLVRFFPNFFRKLFIKDKYDIEIACTYLTPSFILSDRCNCRKYTWVHGPLNQLDYKSKKNIIKKLWWKYIFIRQRSAFEVSDKIIVISNYVYDSVVETYPQFKNKIIKIYNGYDLDFIKIKSKEKEFKFEKPTIVSVGRLDINKNHKLLVEVAHVLKGKITDFQIVIIGEGEERGNLQKLIKELCMDEYVKLYGYKDNPYVYIRAADVLILPSFSEGFPTVIAEAMILKTPVIMTKVSGSEELTRNGECGILVERDKYMIAENILKLISESNYSDEIVQKAYKNIEKYSIKKQADEFMKLF